MTQQLIHSVDTIYNIFKYMNNKMIHRNICNRSNIVFWKCNIDQYLIIKNKDIVNKNKQFLMKNNINATIYCIENNIHFVSHVIMNENNAWNERTFKYLHKVHNYIPYYFLEFFMHVINIDCFHVVKYIHRHMNFNCTCHNFYDWIQDETVFLIESVKSINIIKYILDKIINDVYVYFIHDIIKYAIRQNNVNIFNYMCNKYNSDFRNNSLDHDLFSCGDERIIKIVCNFFTKEYIINNNLLEHACISYKFHKNINVVKYLINKYNFTFDDFNDFNDMVICDDILNLFEC